MLTHVDLFSGIGGFALAAQWVGVKTIAFSEIDHHAIKVLNQHWPDTPNYGDVRGFPSLSAWLLTAGVPCQPASVAGKRKGAADDRWLWPQTLAVIENGSYEWLLFENPTGILSLNDGLEFERICAALEGQNYEVQPIIIPACAIGADHKRERVYILAHSPSRRWQGNMCDSGSQAVHDLPPQALAAWHGSGSPFEQWSKLMAQPGLCRVADGVSSELDIRPRLRGYGNAVVPRLIYQIIKRMVEAVKGETYA